MNVRTTLAITKTARGLSRVLGRGGGHALPGLIAERLDPHLARTLAAQLPHGVIIVTGTNGKTTTTKLIAGILEAAGERVLTNSTGSNLKRGVTSALIAAANRKGKLDGYTIGLFEVDEASLRLVTPEVNPRHIVVLNLFRDQLDRYGELDTLARLIGEGIAATNAQIYLNADDPLVANLAQYAKEPSRVHYFGIEGLPAGATAHSTAVDSDRCPICHERLIFSRVFYGHIGHYYCRQGHFSRPQPSVAITGVTNAELHAGSHFTIAIEGKRSNVYLPLPGTYNLYNALAAMTIGHGLGIASDTMSPVLAITKAAFGRVEQVELEGRRIYLLLIKNPAGFAQVLETFLLPEVAPHVLFVVNDNYADGRDVSWLWDVPLEALEDTNPVALTAGNRGFDMALRLKYAGIAATESGSIPEAVAELVRATPKGGTAYILPTYTAMLQVRKLLAKAVPMQEVWK